MKLAMPSIGDFVVRGDSGGFVIERRDPGNAWEKVSVEKHRLPALEIARKLAKSAGTRAWTYELDNQYSELSTGG